MNSGAGCEYTHVDVGGVEVFACVTAASASCSFSFTGTGYGNQVFGADGFQRATFIRDGVPITDVNASRVESFRFSPTFEPQRSWWEVIFVRPDPSNPHNNSLFREQFRDAQNNAFE